MNRKIPFDGGLIVAVLLLVGFGLVMVFSTASVTGEKTQVFTRQLIFVLAGLALMLAAMHIDYRMLAHPLAIYGMVLLSLGGLAAVFFFPEVNGAHRWISLGFVRGQPSEFAKLGAIFFTAYFLTQKRTALSSWKGLLSYGLVIGLILGLIVLEPDFGTASTLALVCAALLFVGGVRFHYFVGAALAALPVLYFLILSVPYRRERLLAFVNPEESPLGIGYQIRQSLIAVGSGGWTGVGLAQSKQKLFYLPEAHTDFIFAIIGEELGFLGCVLVVAVFLFLFWRGVKIALRADTPLGTLLGLGIVGMVVMQALINMSVVVSLLPPKGIPLPFVSVGGSSILCNLVGMGVLLNISRFSRAEGSPHWIKGSNV